MVVPTDRVSSEKSRTYLGNSQTITVGENYSTIKVIGNSCTLNVLRNDGCVKVIGDGCKVSVKSGRGTVNYVGNNGHVEVGENFDGANVEYVGNSGKVLKAVKGKLEEQIPSRKTTVNCNGIVNLNNKKSVHIGNCQKVHIPYYRINVAAFTAHKKR